MSVYRRKFVYKGKPKRCATYTAEFRWDGTLYRKNGFIEKAAAEHWVRVEQIRLSRNESGYLPAMVAQRVAPLLEQYLTHLRAEGCDDMYVYIVERRLGRLAKECAWITLGDITAKSFIEWRANKPQTKKRAIKGPTLNQFLDHAKNFCRWLVKPMTLLPASPLDSVSDVVAPENHAYRRGGTLEEFQKLLTTCPKDRRLQYAFRLYCPLRADSIRSLRWRDLHLDATPAWGEVDAWHNKGRRRIKFAIRADLVALLRSSAGRPAAAVFPDVLTAADLRDDLARAGVAFSDDDGNRRLDFHAFRRSFIKLGKSAGMTVEDLRHALHHRDVATTRKHYDDDEIDVPMVMAAESLPGLISDSDSGGSKPRSRMKSDALGRTRKKKHT